MASLSLPSCSLAVQLMGDAADAPEKSFLLPELISSSTAAGSDSISLEFSKSSAVGLVTQVNLRLTHDAQTPATGGDKTSLKISKMTIFDVKQPNQSMCVDCDGVVLSRDQSSASIKSKRLLAKVSHAGFALCVRFSSCGQMFAVSCDDATVYIWSHQGFCLPNGLEIWQGKRLMGHELNVTHLEWSPDDQMIASASFDNTVRVWSVASGTMITRLVGHASYVRGVAWDPVGSYLYSQGDDGLRCWKIETWRQHSERTFEPPFGRCSEEVLYVYPPNDHIHTLSLLHMYHRLGISPDGSHIAAIGITKDKLNVCSMSHRADLSSYVETSGHKAPVCAVAFNPHFRQLEGSNDHVFMFVTCSQDKGWGLYSTHMKVNN